MFCSGAEKTLMLCGVMSICRCLYTASSGLSVYRGWSLLGVVTGYLQYLSEYSEADCLMTLAVHGVVKLHIKCLRSPVAHFGCRKGRGVIMTRGTQGCNL